MSNKFRKVIIRLLFRLLKLRDHTDNLMLFSDMDKFTDYDPDTLKEVKNAILTKYMIAKAEVYNNSKFIQYLYYMVVEKQREHVMSTDKHKLAVQQATILFILKLIEELKQSDIAYMEMRKNKNQKAKIKKAIKSDQDNHVAKAYKQHEEQLEREKAQFEHLNNK